MEQPQHWPTREEALKLKKATVVKKVQKLPIKVIKTNISQRLVRGVVIYDQKEYPCKIISEDFIKICQSCKKQKIINRMYRYDENRSILMISIDKFKYYDLTIGLYMQLFTQYDFSKIITIEDRSFIISIF